MNNFWGYVGIAFILAWVWNIVLFIQSDFKAPYKREVIRGIGIVFVPLGGITGFINIDD